MYGTIIHRKVILPRIHLLCFTSLLSRNAYTRHRFFHLFLFHFCRGRPCTYAGFEGVTLKSAPTRRCRVRALNTRQQKRLARVAINDKV